MTFETTLTTDERKRVQALKAQLNWKCVTIHQGNRFRLAVNPYKRIHTIYFPKNTDYNPTLYHYLMEVTRAFYTEKYGPCFGDPFFDPSTKHDDIPLLGSLVSISQHWFTSQFCQKNFADIWHKTLEIKYNSFIQNPAAITQSIDETLNAALICAQRAWGEKKSTSTLIAGSLQEAVNAFVVVDPSKVAMPPLAILVNSLLELYKKKQHLAV